MRILHHIVLAPLLLLAGCQVISGLTGVSLDGENENDCQKVADKVNACDQGSDAQGGVGSGGDSGKSCTDTEACEASCLLKVDICAYLKGDKTAVAHVSACLNTHHCL
jgi:hypothetical protein